uniref:hypothetical protein n=1 Tax=Polyopes affinis TaxID=194519 RepID=UPI002A81B93F|nr:hypothetical protein NDC12_pgp192 [Polyopes affinis]WOL36944.1 hypothetical protein [Polyopes affinis]
MYNIIMITQFIISITNKLNYHLNYLSLQVISLFSGFFIATIISTLPSQTEDWSIIAGAIIVACSETISKFIYSLHNSRSNLVNIINCIKIGIIYGLFVDAFKLGS